MSRMVFGLLAAVLVSACSTEQAYHSLKGWQRNECNRRIDNRERERCLTDADTSYDDYNKQRAQ